MDKNLVVQDWYQALVEECDAIVTETVFLARWQLIEGYHKLGSRILEDYKNFERQNVYGKDIVQCIARSTGKSKRTIYYAIQFASKYKDINELPEGKNISWYKVCTKLLPETNKEDLGCSHLYTEVVTLCKACNHRISL